MACSIPKIVASNLVLFCFFVRFCVNLVN
uniref:Uncharacterized protein n=1 Tax=Anguilla anguilla TaxID=7936 RepID=A0A0E9SH26_ANGAN